MSAWDENAYFKALHEPQLQRDWGNYAAGFAAGVAAGVAAAECEDKRRLSLLLEAAEMHAVNVQATLDGESISPLRDSLAALEQAIKEARGET